MVDRHALTDLPLLAGNAFRMGPAESATRWRAIKEAPDAHGWYCFPLDSKRGKALPRVIPLDELVRRRQAGELTPLNPDEDKWLALGHDLSEKGEIRFKKNWAIVRTVLDNEDKLLDRKQRASYLKTLKKRHDWSPDALMAKMDQYYRGGAYPLAVAPGFDRCGAKGKQRGSPKSAAYQLTEADEAFIAERSRDRNSTRRDRGTVQSITVDLNKQNSEVTRETAAGIPSESRSRAKASKRQIGHRLGRSRKSAAVQLQQMSPEQVQSRHRSRVGSAAARATAPGEVYEIDAWHNAEQELLHPLSHLLKMPRLLVWGAVDVSTGHVVNVYPDFRPESQESFLAALYHLLVAEPNPRWDDLLPGIRRRQEGNPRVLRLDGISRAYASDQVVALLGMQIDTVPPRSGDEKPFAESFNEWMRSNVVKGRTGSLLAEEAARGVTRLRPTYCLTDFMLDLHCGLVTFDKNPISVKQYPAGLRPFMTTHPIRESLWDAAERYGGRVLRRCSRDLMRRVLLPNDDAKVTGDGIMVDGRPYTCKRAEEEKWFSRGVRGAPRSVKVIEDPLRRGRVWLDRAAGGELEALWLLPGFEDFEELQLVEAAMWTREEAKRVAKANDEKMDALVLYAHQRDAIKARARKRVREQARVLEAGSQPTREVAEADAPLDELNDEEQAILARMKEKT